MRKFFISLACILFFMTAHSQNVGIGTTNPAAKLHVIDSSVLFSAVFTLPITPGNPPASGSGTRMMWYPAKASFRVGSVLTQNWDKNNIGSYSFASGYNTLASGNYAISMGEGSSAVGRTATAFGTGTALGDYSAAFNSSIANNTAAVSMNYGSANGLASVAMGQSTANGSFSTAMGNNAIASGVYSTAMGSSTASGDLSTAMGYSVAKAYGSFSAGLYNDINDAPDAANPLTTDRIFQVGIGNVITTSRNNAMTILRNGNVGIGTLVPNALLDIRTNSSQALPNLLLYENETNDLARLQFQNTGSGKFWQIGGFLDQATQANCLLNFYVDGTGDVLTLKGNGNATLMGTLTSASDARLKKDIVPLNNSLRKISRLNGYHYRWINPNMDQDLQTGVLAQEVQKEFPELVKEDAKGSLSVNYDGLIPHLLEAIKEQEQRIDKLEKRLAELEK